MKNFLKNKNFFLLPILIISVLVFWRWFFDFSILTSNDWFFTPLETRISFLRIASLWNSDHSFGFVDLGNTMYPINTLWGILAFFGIESYGIGQRLIYFFPSVLFASLGSFLLVRSITHSNIGGFIGALVFSFNTYFLIGKTGHLTLMTAFAIAPLVVYFFIFSLKKQSFFFSFLAGLLGALMSFYEMRSFYLVIIILFLYFLYYSLVYKKLSSWKVFLKTCLLSSVPILLVILLNFYWVFGFSFLGVIANNDIFNRGLFGDSFMNIKQSFALFHPFWTGREIENFKVQPIPIYFFLIPFFALFGLFLNKKNKEVVFFGIVSLLGILLSKQSGQPFESLYLWLYTNFPGFNAFRESSKFFFFIALGYSILIGAFFSWIWKYWDCGYKKYTKYVLFFLVSFLFLWNTKPLITGEIKTLFIPRSMPEEYSLFEDFILSKNEYFRTLWVPTDSRWGLYSNQNPKVNTVSMAQSQWDSFIASFNKEGNNFPIEEQIVTIFKRKFSDQLLDISSIKYVIVPLQDISNDDDFFVYYGEKQFFVDTLDKISYLEKIDGETGGLAIYQNKNFRPHIYKTKEKETIYEDISYENVEYTFKNPTEYKVILKNVSDSLFVNFSESYHPAWRLRVGNFHWWEVLWDKNYFLSEEYHSENDAKLNSFSIDPHVICKERTCTNNADGSWDIELTLYFKPQSYFYIGLIISGATFVGCLGYLGWYGMRKSKWFRKKEYE